MNGKIEPVEFYDIYEYYYRPLWQRAYFKTFFILLCILIIGVVAYFIFRYFSEKRRAKKLLPWEWATGELQNLSLAKCTTKKDYKKFYFDLTLIIKRYLNRRFHWNTEDKTDEELLKLLEENKFDTSLLEGLKNLVEGALWIKFADEEALKVQAERDLQTGYQIIEKT